MDTNDKVNILIVDDHRESLIALEAVLERPHYNIIKASSGEEALRQLLKNEFALILLDVQMPDMNGFEIARLVRQREKNRHVPIIFITGFGKDERYISEGYSVGAVDYMLKPIDPEVLKAKAAFFTHLYSKNEALREAGEKYRELVEAARVIVWRAEIKSLQFTFVSKEAENLLGHSIESWVSDQCFWKDWIHPEDRSGVMQALTHPNSDEPIELEYRVETSEGRYLWFHTMVHLVLREGDITELIGIMFDVTERKLSEEAIRRAKEELEARVQERTAELEKTKETAVAAEQRFRDLVEGLDGIVWEAEDPWMHFRFVSRKAETMLGYSVERWLHEPDFWERLIYPEDRKIVAQAIASLDQSSPDQRLEYRVLSADGTVVWLNNNVRLTSISPNGSRTFHGIMLDITDRKTAEETIRGSLHEKELLLKEIHHRVKNNLQIIYSLLNLQKAHSNNPDSLEVLTESQNRLRAMALIHEKLYETKNLARIDFADYIKDLINYLFRSYGVQPEKIRLNIDSQDVLLNMDTAIPCGLIIHELVSNALKHAFPDGRDGEISIELNQENGSYRLKVSDNGVGLPPTVNIRESSSLGMKLVGTLTHQLDGVITMDTNPGTRFNIVFSELKH